MASWSGLYDDVHGTPYATLSIPLPISRKLYREIQKRGNYSVAKSLEDVDGTGAVVPSTRDVLDHDANALGGLRTYTATNTATAITKAQMHTIFDTKLQGTYVADLSGNGGKAL